MVMVNQLSQTPARHMVMLDRLSQTLVIHVVDSQDQPLAHQYQEILVGSVIWISDPVTSEDLSWTAWTRVIEKCEVLIFSCGTLSLCYTL